MVTLAANGGERADVRVGDTVTFDAAAEVPPGAGTLVRAEWDFDGSGAWPAVDDAVDGTDASVSLSRSHTFDAPGTYFPAVRVTAQRDGDPHASALPGP